MNPQKILFIDDERDLTEIVGTLLRFHNLSVDTLNNARLLDRQLETAQYDLVVTDLMMPAVSGFDIVHTLRAHPTYHDVPIIALSAKILTDAERKLLLQQRVAMMVKPFEPHALVEQIKQTLATAAS